MKRKPIRKQAGTRILSLFIVFAILCATQCMMVFAAGDDALATAKSSARSELENYQKGQSCAGSDATYNKVLWDAKILSAGEEIDNADTEQAIEAAVSNAKAQIDMFISGTYRENAKNYEQEVRNAKRDLALADLAAFKATFHKDDYFDEDWDWLEQQEAAGRSNIRTVASNKNIFPSLDGPSGALASIDDVLEGAKERMNAVPKNTDPAAIALHEMKEELAAYKKQIIDEINRDYTSQLGNYTNNMNRQVLETIIENTIYDINKIEVAEGENVASPGSLSEYTKRVDIRYGRMKAEFEDKKYLFDAAIQAGHITRAKKELESYKDPKNYLKAQQDELSNAILAWKNALGRTKTEAEARETLAAAKAEIDKIKTKEQIQQEEKNSGEKNSSEEKKNSKKILPKKTSISGKITAQKKGFTVKWKKQTKDVGGYEVSYSTSKKFTKKTTITKTIAKKTTTKLTVKRLKAKKKYYVRVRTYKRVGGKKYTSAWSPVKTVITKK